MKTLNYYYYKDFAFHMCKVNGDCGILIQWLSATCPVSLRSWMENLSLDGKWLTSLNSGLRVFFFTVVLYLDFLPMSGCKTLCKKENCEKKKWSKSIDTVMTVQTFPLQKGAGLHIACKTSKEIISKFCLLTLKRQQNKGAEGTKTDQQTEHLHKF